MPRAAPEWRQTGSRPYRRSIVARSAAGGEVHALDDQLARHQRVGGEDRHLQPGSGGAHQVQRGRIRGAASPDGCEQSRHSQWRPSDQPGHQPPVLVLLELPGGDPHPGIALVEQRERCAIRQVELPPNCRKVPWIRLGHDYAADVQQQYLDEARAVLRWHAHCRPPLRVLGAPGPPHDSDAAQNSPHEASHRRLSNPHICGTLQPQ